jgi:large subunit ribosomal protein L24
VNKIRKGDEALVLSGRDKGARGVVERVLPGPDGKPERVVLRGINMASHYQRPNPQKNEPGGIVKREASLHVSNVAATHPESKLPARVKIEVAADGKKTRRFYVSSRRQS